MAERVPVNASRRPPLHHPRVTRRCFAARTIAAAVAAAVVGAAGDGDVLALAPAAGGTGLPGLMCRGGFTSEEFPQECRCGKACFECPLAADASRGGAAGAPCLRCKGIRWLVDERGDGCVSESACAAAGGTPAEGNSAEGRRCMFAARRAAATEADTPAAERAAATASLRDPLPSDYSPPPQPPPPPQGSDGCRGRATLVGTRCVCARDVLTACVGDGCTSAWVRGTPEYHSGYSPRHCPNCRCVAVAKPAGHGARQAQAAFVASLMQRLRRLVPVCPYVHRYLSLLRNPSREDLWQVVGTERRDPARARGPAWIVAGAQKAGTSAFFAALTASAPFAAPRAAAAPGGVGSYGPDVNGGATGAVKEIHFFDLCLGVDQPRSANAARIASESAASTRWCNLTAYAGMAEAGRAWAARARGVAPGSVSVGDASPSYFAFPEIPALVRAVTPGVKVVVMLREPVARAYSGYLQSHTAFPGVPFAAAVEREMAIVRQCEVLFPDEASGGGGGSGGIGGGSVVRDGVGERVANGSAVDTARYTRCIWPWFVAEAMEASLRDDYVGNRGPEFDATPQRRCTAGMLRKHSVVIRGLYAYQLQLWLDSFGPRRVRVVEAERFFADPDAVVADVRAFLDAPGRANGDGRLARERDRNSRAQGSRPDEATRAKLDALYRRYNGMLARVLARSGLGAVSWAPSASS